MFSLFNGSALYAAVLFSLFLAARSCPYHDPNFRLSDVDFPARTAENLAARALRHRAAPSTRIALNNVRVFDGSTLQPPSTVIIDGGVIGGPCNASNGCTTTQSYDGKGMTLLPGLMDSHAHPTNNISLVNMTRFGVTTAVNAFCPQPMFCESLTKYHGLTSLVTASFFATVNGSEHAAIISPQDDYLLIANTSVAPSWVAGQIKDGADFIKLIGSAPLTGNPPVPGLSQAEQIALVTASHQQGKQVVLHTSSYKSYEEGLIAGVDQIHHSTLDVPVDDRLLAMFKARKATKVVCPTLTMMRAITQQDPSMNASYAPAQETVTRLHIAGIPIIAGTDANMGSELPANVMFGSSLHDELENLVAAGLSPIEALNAATVLPAGYFGLTDRGVIKEGMRADLLLVDGDPTTNITATRNIVKVWVGGIEFADGAQSNATAPGGTGGTKPSTSTGSASAAGGTATSTADAMKAAATLLAPGLSVMMAYMALQ